MSDIWEKPLKDFRDALSSTAPTPGGGAAGAVVAALGAGLLIMAAEIAAKRTGADPSLSETIPRLRELMRDLSAQAPADTAAYENYVNARGKASGTPDEATARAAAMEDALYKAADVPVTAIHAALKAMEAGRTLAGTVHLGILSDVDSGRALLYGATHAELATLAANIRFMKDELQKKKYSDLRFELSHAANEANAEIQKIIRERLAASP